MPVDLKDAGVVAEFVRWGNPHHGIVDGTTLDDGAALLTHPALVSYYQHAGLWVTPALEFVVPGHSFTAPAVPVAGENWLDYAILAGARRTLYQTDVFSGSAAGHAGRFLVSFGVGDSWVCAITGSSITATAGGGSAACSLELAPFGQFAVATAPVPAHILLSAPALSPCGQPLFSGGDDFADEPMKLLVFDVSANGQSVILGIVREGDPLFYGYAAPRGFLRLDISKTGATLSLLKSRADLLVSVNQTNTASSSGGLAEALFVCSGSGAHSVSVPPTNDSETRTLTASNLFCAYFDAAGAVDYLRYEVSSSFSQTGYFDGYTINCSACISGTSSDCDVAAGTVINATNAGTHSGSVAVRRVSDSVALASTSFSDSGSYSGTCSYLGSDSWHNVGAGTAYVYTGNALGGTAYSVNKADSDIDVVSGTGERGAMGFVLAFPEYGTTVAGTTSYTASPEDVAYTGIRVMQVGMLGLVSHYINLDPIETFAGAARHWQPSAIPGSATDSPVVCAHPRSGQVIHKMVASYTTPPPAYGWA